MTGMQRLWRCESRASMLPPKRSGMSSAGVRGPAGLLRDEGPRSRRTEGDDSLPREVPGSLARRHERGGGLTIH
eukprot:scaffold67752_cov48-Phaeocystis_antarctica.AAC.1